MFLKESNIEDAALGYAMLYHLCTAKCPVAAGRRPSQIDCWRYPHPGPLPKGE
jgi:hypothetical protein